MCLIRFYLACIARASRSAWGTTGRIALLLALAGGALAYFVPQISGLMSILVWAIPLGVLLVVFLIGLAYAPYSIYKEEKNAREILQRQLDDKARRRRIREQLANLLEEGGQIRHIVVDPAQPLPILSQRANAWGLKVQAFLRTNLDESYVARFLSNAGLPIMTSPNISARYRNLWRTISNRMARLDQFIQELGG